MVQLPPAGWDTFIDLVEGNESETSCNLVDGVPRFSIKAIPPKADPNLKALADLFRSDVEIPRQIRDWLADLCAPAKPSARRLKLNKGKGQPRKALGRHHAFAGRVLELMETGSMTKVAATRQAKAEMKLQLSGTAAREAIRSYKKALEEHDRVSQEEAAAKVHSR